PMSTRQLRDLAGHRTLAANNENEDGEPSIMTRSIAAVALAALLSLLPIRAEADPMPPGGVGQNVEAVRDSNPRDKPGFKMSIQKVGERWYLYIGMLWNEGWHIVDVTDPKDPKVVKEIEGPPNTATDQMEIADGRMITALAKISPGWGGDPSKPFDE